MLKKTFSLIAFLFFVITAFAQMPSQIIFSRLTKKEGLASNTTFQTARDKEGFLWIATQNGLQRYDGNRFLTFRHIPGDTTSLAANIVNHLYIDKRDRLWILFDTKIGLFNSSNFTFRETKIKSPVNMIKKIMEDDKGKIILFADSKQFVFDEKANAFNSGYPLPVLPANYTIGDLSIEPSSNTYWFTGKQGSLLYDPKTSQFINKEQRNEPVFDSLLSFKNARYPFIAKDSSWWMVNWMPFTGIAPVLYHYDKNKKTLQSFEKIRAYKADSYYEIWSIFQQSNGTIWIYGMGLLAYYDPGSKGFIVINSDPVQQHGIDYDMVSNLYEDKEQNVWVCTNNGLYRFNTDAQIFHAIPNVRLNDTMARRNAISKIVQTQNNEIWISTTGSGIFSYNNHFQPIPNPITALSPIFKNLQATCMIQRKNAEIWIGLQNGQLVVYEPSTNQTSVLSPSLFKEEIIEHLFEDKQGNTWIGSNSGLLVKCTNGNWKDSTAFKTILSDVSDIFRLYEDDSNHLWVCTASTGVYKMDPNDGRVLKQYRVGADNNEGLLNDGATDIVQWKDSLFLIASDGLCILNNKTNKFKYLTAADGMPAEHISTFVVDKQKRLWVALDAGLYRLNVDNKLYVSYDAADGILNNDFQASSATILQNGNIAIGTQHDFVVFDPEKAIDKKEVPAIQITGFALNNKYLPIDSIQHLDKLVLPHDKTFMHIELSTLSFRDHYYMYYMLDGLDKTWKPVYNNEITYQYLPPGDYTLKLKSQNGDAVESKKITTLQIHVDPPFWETWWFIISLALLIVALLFWLDHQRMKRKEAIQKMRSNIADGLHREINDALGNITILSEMAKIKADTEPKKSKEFIEQIHTRSNNMTTAMDDILWSIDPNNDSMENFVLRYREYIDSLKIQHNVQVDMLVDKKVNNLLLNMKMRNDIFWLFKGGIRNVIKTGAKNCRIHISYDKPNLIYTLEFDTLDVDPDQLKNLRFRKELLDKIEDVNGKLEYKEYEAKAIFVLGVGLKRGRV